MAFMRKGAGTVGAKGEDGGEFFFFPSSTIGDVDNVESFSLN